MRWHLDFISRYCFNVSYCVAQEVVAKYNKRWADLYGVEAAGMAENYTTLCLEEARDSGITFENLKDEDMKEKLKTVREHTAQLENTPLPKVPRAPRA